MRCAFLTLMFLGLVFLAGCGRSTPDRPLPPSGNPSIRTAQHRSNEARPKDEGEAPASGKVRRFAFDYAFRVRNLKPREGDAGGVVRLWMPCASSGPYQEVTRREAVVPAKISENAEPRFGNRILYLESPIS
jgi:hypothetical protein